VFKEVTLFPKLLCHIGMCSCSFSQINRVLVTFCSCPLSVFWLCCTPKTVLSLLYMSIWCHGLDPPATKNHAVALSLLPPRWDGAENQKKKAKPMGSDKNSLTEWQREKTKTIIILIKRIHRVQFSHRLMLSLLLSSKSPCSSQLPT